MKTFKLKALEIIEKEDNNGSQHRIPLIDGLIINREDEENQWVIEAYIDHQHLSYFEKLREENEVIMLEVKITKETNEPAIFKTRMIGLNEIGSHMNVLFKGKIVDQRNSRIEQVLKSLIDQDYKGEELLEKFKVLIDR